MLARIVPVRNLKLIIIELVQFSSFESSWTVHARSVKRVDVDDGTDKKGKGA